MLSFRRWLDRKRDRRPVIRISRGAYRRRAWWRRWPLAIIALLLILLAALCAPLLVSEPASTARVVTISHASSGGLLLDGAPVSPTLLETRLKALRREPDGVAAVLTKPDPRAEAILNRQGIGWVSPSDGRGGDHGR